jgi:phosphoribosylamine---glycine ligase
MNILIIGSGGREHALAWKVAQSPQVKVVWVAPGNAGTALEKKVKNIPISPTDIQALLTFARQEKIGLTIVGPEAALAAGIVDVFHTHDLPCFGPTQKAAQLESSKAFSKAFMVRHNIPTATYETFDNLAAASAYINKQSFPLVIKEDGLAAGKGVVIAESQAHALETLQRMFSQKNRVVIEEFLNGEEASFIVVSDGQHILPLATSQDHKAIGEGDTGPNTGGMGAYSPAPVVTPSLHKIVMETIIEPTIQGMAKEGIIYQGFLYAGLMIAADGKLKVLEFNCRLGDPETEVVLPRLKSDLVDLCQSALNQTLHHYSAIWDPRFAVGVVLAAEGYPGDYAKGAHISGLDQSSSGDQKIFHAGTKTGENSIVTAGGRVLCVTGMGDSIEKARESAYSAVSKIHWEGKYYRNDIGHRALLRVNAL